MFRRSTWALLTMGALATPHALSAPSTSMTVSIEACPLTDALRKLERQTGIELLYDHALLDGLSSPPIDGELTTEAALGQILAGSNLAARRVESGAWIVERRDAAPLAPGRNRCRKTAGGPVCAWLAVGAGKGGFAGAGRG